VETANANGLIAVKPGVFWSHAIPEARS
jgi:hypothetical protein